MHRDRNDNANNSYTLEHRRSAHTYIYRALTLYIHDLIARAGRLPGRSEPNGSLEKGARSTLCVRILTLAGPRGASTSIEAYAEHHAFE